jgi:hypothetical protein
VPTRHSRSYFDCRSGEYPLECETNKQYKWRGRIIYVNQVPSLSDRATTMEAD